MIAYPESGPQQLLVNVIGNYSGTRWLRPGEYTLEITADGGWTATIEEMTLDDAAIGPLEGEGDFISPIFSATPGPAPYAFTHDGKRNFAVLAYCIDGQDLAVNEIGAVNQEAVVDFRGVACFWDVSADGKWSIKQK